MSNEQEICLYVQRRQRGHEKPAWRAKAPNLAEMTNLGLPVPYGFTISTEACTEYNEGGKKLTDEMIDQIEVALAKLEEIAGKKLGDPENPLLVSVRSGARASMPGMMDTVLNIGLNDISVEGLAKKTGNTRFAYDSYRRFIMMFADCCYLAF